MSSLYVDRKGVFLKLDGDALAFYENDSRIGTVPLAPLERVYLRGDVTLQSSLLGKLGSKGIGVVVLSGKKGEASLMMAQPHNDAARRVAQYRLSQDAEFCLTFSRCVVELKLQAQYQYLMSLRENNLQARYALTAYARHIQEAIDAINAKDSIASLRGLEGHAAAQYFSGLAAALPESLHFSGRNRQPPKDPFNVVLSLGYTLLHAEAVIALFGAGLDPFVGFYHSLDFGRESLACDVIEPMRVMIDQFSINLFKSGSLRVEDFSVSEQGCTMGKAARSRFYHLFEEACEEIRKCLTESISDLSSTLRKQGFEASPQKKHALAEPATDNDFQEDLS